LFFLVLHSMRHFVLSLFSPLSLATLIYYWASRGFSCSKMIQFII
jgi:hypothetical protein